MVGIFVLVHGSNGNSFSFGPLLRELALRGHRGLAVDLPGHGFGARFPGAYQAPQDVAGLAAAASSRAGATLDGDAAHVIAVVRRAAEIAPVILLGHSRGGLTVTAVANAVPELLHRIVYLSAWCPVDATVAEYAAGPENATSALNDTMGVLAANPAELGALRMNWRTADPDVLAALKEAMLADGTDDEFRAFCNTLDPDESLDGGGPADRAQRDTWGRVPHTYIRLSADRSMPVALQDRFIREADALTPDNPFDVHTLHVSHVRPLIHPEETAKILAGLAEGPAGPA